MTTIETATAAIPLVVPLKTICVANAAKLLGGVVVSFSAWRARHVQDKNALIRRQATPEAQQGQFVHIIDELAALWRGHEADRLNAERRSDTLKPSGG